MSTHLRPVTGLLLLATLAPLEIAHALEVAAAPPECKYCPEREAGWGGWIGLGLRYMDDDSDPFGRYSAEEERGTRAELEGELSYRDTQAGYLDLQAEGLGGDAGWLHVEGGQQGRYALGLALEGLPNRREGEAYSPLRASTGGRLDLPSGWGAGATTADMPGLAAALQRTPLGSQRDRAALEFSLLPAAPGAWELSGYLRREKKEGVRDQGATIGFTQTLILPIPYTYRTDEFGLTLGYARGALHTRLDYRASLFSSEESAIEWRNPYEAASSNTAWGRMAEAPDNQMHQLALTLGYQLRPDTQLSAELSRGRMSQDQAFLPYTSNPALVTSALPATHLDGRVETTRARLALNTRPTARLRLDASLNLDDRDNQTDSRAYQYVVTDLGIGGTRANRPYGFKQQLLRLKAGYRLPHEADLSLGYDSEQMRRTYVQVEETRDHTLWGRLTLHPTPQWEASLALSRADRDASAYVPLAQIDPLLDNPNPSFYDNPLLRVHHLADRRRDTHGLDLTYTPLEALSLNLTLDRLHDDYGQMYLGLSEAEGITYTGTVSYSLAQGWSGSLFYTYDRLDSEQRGSQRLLPSDADTLWIAADHNRTETLGLAVSWDALPERLDLSAELAYSEYTGTLEYVGGTALPELGSTLFSLTLASDYRLRENLSLRAHYRYEGYRESDWQDDATVNTLPTLLSLGIAPQTYRAQRIYLVLRYAIE